MEAKQLAFRSYSTRRGRPIKPNNNPPSESINLSRMICKDLSLPSIENSICGISPEPCRSKTPSTSSTSSSGSQTLADRINSAPGPEALPSVSAKSWAVCQAETGEVLWGVNAHERKEIASLTKLMTCYLSIRLTKKLHGVSYTSLVKVSKLASMMPGTSAELREGEETTVWDLLHGLMLPSGNDAAWCLAEFFGKKLLAMEGNESPSKNYARYFVKEMNRMARKLRLRLTSFNNPHGLPDPTNRSTCRDLCLLTSVCMRNSRFRDIVSTKSHLCVLYHTSSRLTRRVQYTNTNRLLDLGWAGAKTGVTASAGPCLSACLRTAKDTTLVIVMLNCWSMERRWKDAVTLGQWTKERIGESSA